MKPVRNIYLGSNCWMSIPETSMDAVPCLLELTWPLQHLQLWHCLPKPQGLQAMGILLFESHQQVGSKPQSYKRWKPRNKCLALLVLQPIKPYHNQPSDFSQETSMRTTRHAVRRHFEGSVAGSAGFSFPLGIELAGKSPKSMEA